MAEPVAEPLEVRYERKFSVEGLDRAHLVWALKLHDAHFVRAYPDRYVNSLYFDSVRLTALAESLAGISERRKFRLRWYGQLHALSGPVNAEIKQKRGMIGTKRVFENLPLVQSPISGGESFSAAFADSAMPAVVREVWQSLRPVLANRYRRSYFETICGRIRATVDTEVTYYGLGQHNCTVPRRPLNEVAVLELKYAAREDEFARSVAGGLPFRLSRNSKYCTGVMLLAECALL